MLQASRLSRYVNVSSLSSLSSSSSSSIVARRVTNASTIVNVKLNTVAAGATRRNASSSSLTPVRSALSVRRAKYVHTIAQTVKATATPTDVFTQATKEVKDTPALSIRSVIVRLLSTLSSKKEVDHYLKYYGGVPGVPGSASSEVQNFAVIKIGGGLIQDELDVLVSSLAFLVDVGLLPVVIHGAGPQLNAKLEKMNIVSEYHGGIRVTTPTILQTAKQTFQEENIKLLEALENKGVRARGFVGGVFQAELLDFAKFGYVGEVVAVDSKLIREQIAKGVVPVITCMAEATTGQLLNVNADVAAHQLAKELKPIKIIYLSQAGGLKDASGNMLSEIDLETSYDKLMAEPWFTKGNRLKLKEIKTLLDSLPLSSSVSITSAENLPQELFTHKGSGTLVKRTELIAPHSSLDNVDRIRLGALLESCFGGKLSPEYFHDLSSAGGADGGGGLKAMYLSEQYTATAIVTSVAGHPGIAYLDKFAVSPAGQGTGTAQRLWDHLSHNHPKLMWRSRKDNPINKWYFDKCTGSCSKPGGKWTVFWLGVHDMAEVAAAMERVLDKKANMLRPAELPSGSSGAAGAFANHAIATSLGARGFSSWTNRASGRRSFSSAAAKSKNEKNKKVRVGIIGARGYTGGELITLLASHPRFELVSANSRALVGQSLEQVVPAIASSSASWKGLKFGNIRAEDIAHEQVDLWVMALPNGVAQPFVDALLSSSSNTSRIIDLSADYRFSAEWSYGLPESHGLRSALGSARCVANPGCYATGMQVALLPLLPLLKVGTSPSCFGVSGYSGAGTNPSRKNDLKALEGNLMPYALQGHIHEREVLAQLQSKSSKSSKIAALNKLNFVPHVASWFRGISLTVTAELSAPLSQAELTALYEDYFKGERMVVVQGEIPEVAAIANQHNVVVHASTNATTHPGRVVVLVTIDNLLKGAATQAMQNMNGMYGFDELTAIPLKQ